MSQIADPAARFAEYEREATHALAAAATADELEAARVLFLGKKQGRLRDLQSVLGQVPKEDRPTVGKQFNAVKQRVEAALAAREAELAQPRAAADAIDVTLPGTPPHRLGNVHPLTRTMGEFRDIMGRLGFTVVEGPEVEDEAHNFTALNIPEEHPARDPLDNFYLAAAGRGPSVTGSGGGPLLLRSQTSTVQIRVMAHTPPPVRIVSLGRVYRPDTIDATHHCQFHQMEGLMVGQSVTMATLKTVLTLFCRAYLGDDVEVRFRPSFFPFTEPSVEADVRWKGGWLELGGAGMVDPAVLTNVGYDPETVTGFAFGLGVERFCMLRHGIDDIRLLTENDVRFLRQFAA